MLSIMMKSPVLKPHFDLVQEKGGSYFLVYKNKAKRLKGKFLEFILPLLDGRDTADIIKALKGLASVMEIYHVINYLDVAGYLVEKRDLVYSPEEKLYYEISDSRFQFFKDQNLISLKNLTVIQTSIIKKYFTNAGFKIANGPSAIQIVICTDFLNTDLEIIAKENLKKKIRWLAIKPTGAELWITPLIRPDVYWDCLKTMILNNNRLQQINVKGFSTNKIGWSRNVSYSYASITIALGIAALQLKQFLLRTPCDVNDPALFTIFDLQTFTLTSLPLLPCGICNKCVKRWNPQSDIIEIKNIPKTSTEHYWNRKYTAHHLLPKLLKYVNEILGIVPRIEQVNDLDSLIYIYCTGVVKANVDVSSVGKYGVKRFGVGYGRTAEKAMCAAICEALAHYCGSLQGNEAIKVGSFNEISDSIDPSEVMQFSERQYKERNRWNKSYSLLNRIPKKFQGNRKFRWSPLWSLTTNKVRYLPTILVYENTPGEISDNEKKYLTGDSNGRATGGSIEEALFYAILEIIERDSIGIWWYNQHNCLKVDIENNPSLLVKNLKHYYSKLGRELQVLDITSDLNIPVFAAVSYRKETYDQVILGFGCHLNPEEAVESALCELAQSLGPVQQFCQNPDTARDRDIANWWQNGSVMEKQFSGIFSIVSKKISDYQCLSTDSWKKDIDVLLAPIHRAGLEVMVSNQSRDQFNLNVVKVIIPGMCSIRPRFNCKRIYQKPYLNSDKLIENKELSLNPYPLPV